MVGHMTSSLPFFHASIARLITALNQNLVKVETASSFTLLERQTVHMIHALFYPNLPDYYTQCTLDSALCLGIVCSGGTVANLTALWIARNNLFKATDTLKSIKEVGLMRALTDRKYTDVAVIGSTMMHYSFRKALDILGLGECNLHCIPTTASYQIRVDLLESKIVSLRSQGVCIIALVGIAGTTETGAIDDLEAIAQLAQKYAIHFHIDAAWSGPLIFSRHAHLLSGIERCDSIAIDGHKQLYTPQGLGILLLKSPTSAQSIRQTSQYIIREASFDSGKFGVEGSRPANFLYLHAALHLIGKKGYDWILTSSTDLVHKLWLRLCEHPSRAFECLHEPMTNILLYRYISSDLRVTQPGMKDYTASDTVRINWFTVEMQERMKLEKGSFVSRTRVKYNGEDCDAFRVVVANPLTTWKSLDDLIEQQLSLGMQLELIESNL